MPEWWGFLNRNLQRECPICKEVEDLERDAVRSESSLIKLYCSERGDEIRPRGMSDVPGETAELEKEISLNGLELPYLYLRAYLLDLIGRSGEKTVLIQAIDEIRDPDAIRAAIEATAMSGISRRAWSPHIGALLDLADRFDSYEVTKSLYRILILAGVMIDEDMLSSIVEVVYNIFCKIGFAL